MFFPCILQSTDQSGNKYYVESNSTKNREGRPCKGMKTLNGSTDMVHKWLSSNGILMNQTHLVCGSARVVGPFGVSGIWNLRTYYLHVSSGN